MASHGINRLEGYNDLKVGQLVLDSGTYCVYCTNRNGFHHLLPIVGNVIYDRRDDSRELYVDCSIQKGNIKRRITMSNVLVITTSLRARSNSDILAEQLIAGAKEAGHSVGLISLKGKEIRFCIGCLACQKTQRCIQKDDAPGIADKVLNADTLVFVTPIYYYEMSGQMKTLLDRLNPLYSADYKFRRMYMLSIAAEDEGFVPKKAVSGLQGWVDCFEKAELSGSLFCGGLNDSGEASGAEKHLKAAFDFGRSLE